MNYMRQSGHFLFEEDPFAKNALDIAKSMHETLLLLKLLQAKLQVKNMKKRYYDLHYTIIKNLSDERGEK